MYKCKNCGYEFDGKFCPECGTKREAEEPIADTAENKDLFDFKENATETAVVPKDLPERPNAMKRGALSASLTFLSKISARKIKFLFPALLLIVFSIGLIAGRYDRVPAIEVNGEGVSITAVNIIAVISGIAGFILTAFCIFFLLKDYALPDYNELVEIRGTYKKSLYFCIFCVLVCIILTVLYSTVFSSEAGTNLRVYISALVLFVLFSAFCIAVLLVIRAVVNAYVDKDPCGVTVSYLNPYIEELNELKQKNRKTEFLKYNANLKVKGKPELVPEQYEKHTNLIKIVKSAVIVLLATAVLLCVTFIPRNVFSLKYMEKISVGDSVSYIGRILGEPYENSMADNENLSGTYVYCNSPLAKEIAKKNGRIEELANSESLSSIEKMLELAIEVAELETEMNSTRNDYITVSFNLGKVTSIRFLKDALYGEIDYGSLKVNKITYAESGNSEYDGVLTVKRQDTVLKSVGVRLYFSDGSFENKTVMCALDISSAGVYEYVWSDTYGEHEMKVIVK